MKNNKSEAGLPHWFDITKYKDTGKLTPRDWWQELHHRYKIRHSLSVKDRKKAFEALQETPLLSQMAPSQAALDFNEGLACAQQGAPTMKHGIPELEGEAVLLDLGERKDLDVLDQDNLTHAEPEYFESWWASYPKGELKREDKHTVLKHYLLAMDRGYSEDELQTALRKYISYCRQTNKTGTRHVHKPSTFLDDDEHLQSSWELYPEMY